jgi:hypothetical protein
MPKISPEKRREYNERYRAKQKSNKYLEASTEAPSLQIEKLYHSPPPSTQCETDSLRTQEEDNGNLITLDRETYEYLLQNFQIKDQEKEEVFENSEKTPEKQTEKTEGGGSFLDMLGQQTKVALASTLPLLALKLLLSGASSSISLMQLPTTTQQEGTQESSAQPSQLRAVNFELL